MFDPELVIYNAGTDILDGDPLGRLKVMLHMDLVIQMLLPFLILRGAPHTPPPLQLNK